MRPSRPRTAPATLSLRAWLSLEALRILLDHGAARGVLFPASYSTVTAIALRDDYDAAYRASHRILTHGESPRL